MDWTIKTEAGVELADVLNFTPAKERTKIVTKLYDGSYNVQTVGDPTDYADATICVESMSALRAVNESEASCVLLTLRYRDVDYYGYICDEPKWKPVLQGSVYTASIKFLVVTA
jgi:hypothetical protein